VEVLKKNIPFYQVRKMVKPGLTGWAQINYRASTTVDEAKIKFEYDLFYIKNRSVILDLGIMFKTIRPLFLKTLS
ncbi:sugar transferase, partial [Candidatus Uhrbacteria bacterium]|nr:sugar transferase [Candidatus Uhrbacteria bacterium]